MPMPMRNWANASSPGWPRSCRAWPTTTTSTCATPRRRATSSTSSKPWSPAGVRMASPQELQSRLAGVAAGLVLCGHTHRPRVMRSAAGQLLVNPGSVGLPAFDDERPVSAPHRKRLARCALRHRRTGRRRMAGVVDRGALWPRVDGAAGPAERPARLGACAAHRLHAGPGRRGGIIAARANRCPWHRQPATHYWLPPACDLPCSTWTTRCSVATATCCGATSSWRKACLTEGFRARNRHMAAAYTAGSVTPADYCNFYASTLAGHGENYWQPLRERFLQEVIRPRIPDRRTRLAAAAPRCGPHAGADHRHQPRRQCIDGNRPGRGPLSGHRGRSHRRAASPAARRAC